MTFAARVAELGIFYVAMNVPRRFITDVAAMVRSQIL